LEFSAQKPDSFVLNSFFKVIAEYLESSKGGSVATNMSFFDKFREAGTQSQNRDFENIWEFLNDIFEGVDESFISSLNYPQQFHEHFCRRACGIALAKSRQFL